MTYIYKSPQCLKFCLIMLWHVLWYTAISFWLCNWSAACKCIIRHCRWRMAWRLVSVPILASVYYCLLFSSYCTIIWTIHTWEKCRWVSPIYMRTECSFNQGQLLGYVGWNLLLAISELQNQSKWWLIKTNKAQSYCRYGLLLLCKPRKNFGTNFFL